MLKSIKSFGRKTLLPAIALATMWSNAFGQSYNLEGTVRSLNSRYSGNKLENVKVDIDSGKYIGKTDANGNYLIPNIPKGNHTIRFSKIGSRGFLEKYTLNSNSTFNASLPDTMQTISIGTDNMTVKNAKEMIDQNAYDLDNSSFWIRDSLTIPPVFFSRANSNDSLNYLNNIGSFTNDWHDAKVGTIENVLQRKLFLPNTDSIYTRTHNGWIIRFNSNNNTTGVLDNPGNIPYIKLAVTDLLVFMVTVVLAELELATSPVHESKT